MEGKKSEGHEGNSPGFSPKGLGSEHSVHKTHGTEFHKHSESSEQHSPHAHHEHQEHQEHHHEVQPKNRFKKMDAWKISAVVLAVLLLMSVFTSGFRFQKELSSQEASIKALEFINQNLLQGQATAQVKSISENSGLYAIKLDVMGQEYNSYVSKDGNLFFPQAVDMADPSALADNQQQAQQAQQIPQDLVKSDKPTVELFVMSHCPFGTQAEKGILPAVEALGDKIDFDIKFVYYAMHGKTEVDEQTRQVCIMDEQADRYKTYLACFLEDGDSERCLKANNVDMAKLDSCIKKIDEQYGITAAYDDTASWLSGRFPLFNVHKADNQKYSVGGSPTLIINGQEANSGRSPAEYLAAICGAFNQEPEECQETLSASQFSSGFGYDTAVAGVAASCAP